MTRRYSSALRANQAEETRQRILGALAAEMAAGPSDFSLARVAEQAGVSLRTLHHHFPDTESRVAALAAWIDQRVGLAQDLGPDSISAIGPYARRMAQAFFANEQLLRAQLASGVTSQVRRQRRRQREDGIRRAVAQAVPDRAAATQVAALLAALISADTAVVLKDRFGLADASVTRVMEWAAETLADAAAKGRLP